MFHLGRSRGAAELKDFLSDFKGIVSSDRWCAYQIYDCRQLCWAHLPRNFRKLGLRGGKAAQFAVQGEKVCDRVGQGSGGRLPQEVNANANACF